MGKRNPKYTLIAYMGSDYDKYEGDYYESDFIFDQRETIADLVTVSGYRLADLKDYRYHKVTLLYGGIMMTSAEVLNFLHLCNTEKDRQDEVTQALIQKQVEKASIEAQALQEQRDLEEYRRLQAKFKDKV